MGFKYLNNEKWADITREERYFCLELFNVIKGNEKAFIQWLRTNETWYEKIVCIDEDKINHECFFNKECLKYADIFNSIRFSLGKFNYKDEIPYVIMNVKKITDE